MRALTTFVLGLAFMACAAPAMAQAPVTVTDLSRLEATAGEIEKQVLALEKGDPTLAADVSRSLTELSEDITYLRVKMRREGSVTRVEYGELRDRLETLRVRAQGQKVAAQPILGDPEPGSATRVPVGAEFDARLQTSLNSATAQLEQRFEATTVLDYSSAGTVVVPAGSVLRGFVSSVRPAGRLDRRGSLTLSFDEIRVNGTSYRLRASVTQALDSKVAEDATRIGAGAAVGAILGGIFGGGRGALIGVLVGGGGTIAATDGSDVDLPTGTILRVRVDQPLDIVPAAAPAR